MTLLVRPDRCPTCQQPFRLGYSVYRTAQVCWSARLVLMCGSAVTLVLLPLFFFVLGGQVARWTVALGSQLFGLVLSLLPAWLGWRYWSTSARQIKLVCPECDWSGLVWVKESRAEDEFEGVGYVPSPLDSRRERKEVRDAKERRRARAAEHEADPNPDFDFRDG